MANAGDAKINIKVSYPNTLNFPKPGNRSRFIENGEVVGAFMDELAEHDFELVMLNVEVIDTRFNGVDE